MSLPLAKWLRKFAAIPTSFHLWCAERELRMAPNLAPRLRQARARNLEVLGIYRRRGEFPENNHDDRRPTPCFVDSNGRQCAVAFLMDQSGANAAVERVVQQANHARIGEMRFAELETWASESGLTKAELARIQPAYAPTPEQAAKYGQIILAVWFVGALVVNSIVFNMCRLVWAHRPRLTTISLGIVLGIVLLYGGFQINAFDFGDAGRVHSEVANAKLAALAIGTLSVVCAIIPLCVRRGKWQPPPMDSQPALPHPSAPPIEHVKSLGHGSFKAGAPPD